VHRVLNDLSVSSDGRMLVAGAADGYLVTWSAVDLQPGGPGVPSQLQRSPVSLMKPRSAVPIDSVNVLRSEAPGPYHILVGTGSNSTVQVFRMEASLRDLDTLQSLQLKTKSSVRGRVLEDSPHTH
jgi:hypothetical protein